MVCPCLIVPLALVGTASATGGATYKSKMWIWVGISLIATALFIWLYLKYKKGCKTCK